jgi:transcriptional regulator with XRE-family HTH domain
MRTRIREFRKARDMTLKQLADMIGTTPQTVQRLETGTMTVSMEWLEKIAEAFGIGPAYLIGRSNGGQIPFLGSIGAQGYLHAAKSDSLEYFRFDVPADDPVAARFEIALGNFEAGTVLIGNRLRGADMQNAHGLDCIVGLPNGTVLFRWVIRGQGETWTLVPHDRKSGVQYDQPVIWIARAVMAVSFY